MTAWQPRHKLGVQSLFAEANETEIELPVSLLSPLVDLPVPVFSLSRSLSLSLNETDFEFISPESRGKNR